MAQRHELNRTQRTALFKALTKTRETAETYVDQWMSNDPTTDINQAKLSESIRQLQHTISLIALEDRTYQNLINEYHNPNIDNYELAQRMTSYLHL